LTIYDAQGFAGITIARAAGDLRRYPTEPSGGEVQSVNKGIDKTNGVFCPDVFVQRFRQQQRLGSIGAGEVRHDYDSDAS
jgi:hypothetical protein